MFFRNKSRDTLSHIDPHEILADSFGTSDFSDILEGKLEKPLNRFASYLFYLVMGVGFFYLFSKAYALQITHGDNFLIQSQENRFLVRPILAPRGIIYDRFLEPLLENVPSFGLVFEKSLFFEQEGNLHSLLENLSVLLEHDQEYFFTIGFPRDYDTVRLPEGILLMRDVPREVVARLTLRSAEFPGVQIFEGFQRISKDPYAFSHLLGFVGKVSEDDLRFYPALDSYDIIGKSGIELTYNEYLRGKRGRKIVEIDSQGVETRFRLTEDPQAGSGIKLTIDGKLQSLAYRMMKDYTEGRKGGSVVVIDPRSGAVRALVSLPGFDSNRFGTALSEAEFAEVLDDPLRPMFNRALSGEFPPGSTIKPLLAIAGLQELIIDPDKKIYDEGFIEIPNPYQAGERSVFLDWRKHGWVNLDDAIALSANVYFYILGGGYREQKGLGIERIKHYATSFGLGAPLGIDLPGEKSGLIPDPEWKRNKEPEDPVWRLGDTYNVSIGQGGVKVTPLQITALTAAIANGGILYRPYLFVSAVDEKGGLGTQSSSIVIRDGMARQEVIQRVRQGMRKTVISGTAKLLHTLSVSVGAKTGTAQSAPGKLPHAWVTAFAPAENPEIAITVMVEHAGEGATVAVPITREILHWYFSNQR